MIFDEVAEALQGKSLKEIRKKTGLSYDKIRRLQGGCPFILDYETLFALQRLGFEFRLEKTLKKCARNVTPS